MNLRHSGAERAAGLSDPANRVGRRLAALPEILATLGVQNVEHAGA